MSKIKTPEEILQFTLSVDCAKGLLHDTVTNREHNGIKYRMVRDDLALKAIESYHAQFTQPTIDTAEELSREGKGKDDVISDIDKAKMIADQCKPCTDDFYSGIYQGVLFTMDAIKNEPKERTFSITEIEQLQSKVYAITGKGDVMKLFNALLGCSC